jgi:carbamoyl-phosphate synthase large subunit
MGYRIVSTSGTAKVFQEAGITVEVVKKLHEGRPNLLDQMANGEIQMILNTPNGKGARTDEGRIRAASVTYGVPCVTTLPGCLAVVQSLEALRVHPNPRVKAIQDWIA